MDLCYHTLAASTFDRPVVGDTSCLLGLMDFFEYSSNLECPDLIFITGEILNTIYTIYFRPETKLCLHKKNRLKLSSLKFIIYSLDGYFESCLCIIKPEEIM